MSDFAILVLSCDKYADLWNPFFTQFHKFFPDNPYKIYLGSNKFSCEIKDVHSILSGDDLDWSSSLLEILSQIPERKIFIILEDIFIDSNINKIFFTEIVNFLITEDASHIKYFKIATKLIPTRHNLISQIPQFSPFSSTVCGFWDRHFLMRLLIPGEDPWNFEINSSYRISYSHKIYSLNNSLFSYKNMIEKGRWLPASLSWAKKNDLKINISCRPLLTPAQQLMSLIKMQYFDTVSIIPWKFRVNLMNFFRKILVSY